MKLRTTALALAAGSLLLSACGGEDVPKASATAEVDLDGAKSVVVDYFTKAFSGDAAACDHETENYSAEEDAELGTESCQERIESVKPMLTDGEPLIDVSKSVVTMTKGLDGGAVAEVTHELEGIGATYLLVLEDGTWLIDGRQDEGAETEPAEGGPRTVSEEEAVELNRAFCQVEVGSARQDVEKWMGAPDEESIDDDGQTELGWAVNQDSYYVWFADDKVTQFSASTPREKDVCAG